MDKRNSEDMEKKPLEEIASLEEAKEILDYLTVRIEEINLQLKDGARKITVIKQCGKEGYEKWMANARHARMLLSHRQRKLREHMRKKWLGFGNVHNLPAKILTALAYALADGLTEKDVLLFLANPEVVRKSVNVLDEARVLASVSAPQTRAQMLCQLARVTLDEREVAQLELLWKKGCSNDSMRSDVGRWLVTAYLALERYAEAEKVIDSIPLPDDAVYCWLRLFKLQHDNGYLGKARERISQERRPVQQFTQLGALLEQSRSTDDLRRLQRMFSELIREERVENRRRHLVNVYTRALFMCGLDDDACEAIQRHAPDDPAVLFRAARSTKKREYLIKALDKKLPKDDRRGMRTILLDALEACFVCDATDIARRIAESVTDDKNRADLWCRLAEETGDEEDIKRGLAALTPLSPFDADWPRARLMQGLLKQGRSEEARGHLQQFTQETTRCYVYLRIYCAENDLKYPGD